MFTGLSIARVWPSSSLATPFKAQAARCSSHCGVCCGFSVLSYEHCLSRRRPRPCTLSNARPQSRGDTEQTHRAADNRCTSNAGISNLVRTYLLNICSSVELANYTSCQHCLETDVTVLFQRIRWKVLKRRSYSCVSCKLQQCFSYSDTYT